MADVKYKYALAVALIIVSLVGLAAVGGQQPSEAPPLYEGLPADAALLRIDRQALEAAYHDQLKKLFTVWIASQAPSDAVNLRNGLRIARRAYNQALAQIVMREQELLELDRKQQP